MLKRFASLILAVLMVIPLTVRNADAALTDKVTVEEAINALASRFSVNVPQSFQATAVTDKNGGSPSQNRARLVSYCVSKSWLPSSIPAFSQTATVEFTLLTAMSMFGITRLYDTGLTGEAETSRKSMISDALGYVQAAMSVQVKGSVTNMGTELTQRHLTIIGDQLANGNIMLKAKDYAWAAYGKNDLTNAEILFNMLSGAAETSDTLKTYKADIYWGMAKIYRHYSIRQYEKSRQYYNMAITSDPKGRDGVRGSLAVKELADLPANELSPTYNAGAALSYEEFVALVCSLSDYEPGSNDTAVDYKDAAGALPADYAQKYARMAASRDYYNTKPTSWKAPAPKWWIARFLCKMKGYNSYMITNVSMYEDALGLSANDQMYLTLAAEIGFLAPLKNGNFGVNDALKRADAKTLADKIKNSAYTKAALIPRPNGEKPKLHAYYIWSDYEKGAALLDNRSDDLTMLTFTLRDLRKESSADLKEEGTNTFVTSFINGETDDRAEAYLKDLKKANSLGIETYYGLFSQDSAYALSMLSSSSSRSKLVSDLVFVCEKYGFTGVNAGFEHLDGLTEAQHTAFIKELSAALHAKGKKLMTTVGAAMHDESLSKTYYNYKEIGKASDYVHVILFDVNPAVQYNEGGAEGPLSSLDYSEKCIRYAMYSIAADKILLGLGSYAIDFNMNSHTAENISISEKDAVLVASSAKTSGVTTENGADAPYTDYTGSGGTKHRLRYETLASYKNRMTLANDMGLSGISFYYLGSDDGNLYSAFSSVFKTPSTQPPSAADEWAAKEIGLAIQAGLIPPFLQNNYKITATRAELITLLATLTRVCGRPAEPDKGAAAYIDTASPDVLWAYKAGITSQNPATNPFMPLRGLSREETSAMLSRLASNVFGLNVADAPKQQYTDSASIASWAVGAVNYVSSIGVMGSTSSSASIFSPQDRLTRQQAILIVYRLYDKTLKNLK